MFNFLANILLSSEHKYSKVICEIITFSIGIVITCYYMIEIRIKMYNDATIVYKRKDSLEEIILIDFYGKSLCQMMTDGSCLFSLLLSYVIM